MDVIFLLLTFFIYSMIYMVVQRGLPVNLPSSKTAMVENKAVIALTIQADGSLFLDKEPLPLEALTEVLRQRTQQPPNAISGTPDAVATEKADPAIQIFADAELTYGQLYQVLDAIKLSNIRKISLQAKQQ